MANHSNFNKQISLLQDMCVNFMLYVMYIYVCVCVCMTWFVKTDHFYQTIKNTCLYVSNFLIKCLLNFAFQIICCFKLRYNLVNIHWKRKIVYSTTRFIWDVLTEVVPFIYQLTHTHTFIFFDNIKHLSKETANSKANTRLGTLT